MPISAKNFYQKQIIYEICEEKGDLYLESCKGIKNNKIQFQFNGKI